MPLHFTDSSTFQVGAHVGAFPPLADQALPEPSELLHSSANPRMDLVLLVTRDASSVGSAAPAPPPGMSAAQYALVQRMMARRNPQAASTSNAPPEPKRAAQIKLVLWRLGEHSSPVWNVPLTLNNLLDPTSIPEGVSAAQPEAEDVRVHDLAWSPHADRFALVFSLRRVHPSPDKPDRCATWIKTFSLEDGRTITTTRLEPTATDTYSSAQRITWHPIHSAFSHPCATESLLSKLRPLPILPKAEDFASGPAQNLMPHQMRMMQMRMQKPQNTLELPSTITQAGRGPLRDFPTLSKPATELNLIDSIERTKPVDDPNMLDPSKALPFDPNTILTVACPASGCVQLFLDGSVCLGSVSLGMPTTPVAAISASLSPELTSLDVSVLEQDAALYLNSLMLVDPVQMGRGATCTSKLTSKLSRLAHLLHIYTSYALDTAILIRQIWKRDVQEAIIAEWVKYSDELTVKFGADIKLDLLASLLTGRASPAVEQLLMATLTEGIITRFEQNAFVAFNHIKKLLFHSLRPALERMLICLREWEGLSRFSDLVRVATQLPSFPSVASLLIHGAKTCLSQCLALSDLVDVEAITLQEFLRWCRFEKERQERIKQDQEDPRQPINYDTYTVADFIERGFVNERVEQLLVASTETVLVTDEQIAGTRQAEPTASLDETYAAAKVFIETGAQPSASESDGQPELRSGIKLVDLLEAVAVRMGGSLREVLARMLTRPDESRGGGATAIYVPRPRADAASIDSNASARSDQLAGVACRSSEQVVAYATAEDGLALVRGDAATTVIFDQARVLDLGFFDDELVLLLDLVQEQAAVLATIRYQELDWQLASQPARIARVTQLEAPAKPTRISLNPSKKTAAILDESGSHILYLDLTEYQDEDE